MQLNLNWKVNMKIINTSIISKSKYFPEDFDSNEARFLTSGGNILLNGTSLSVIGKVPTVLTLLQFSSRVVIVLVF